MQLADKTNSRSSFAPGHLFVLLLSRIKRRNIISRLGDKAMSETSRGRRRFNRSRGKRRQVNGNKLPNNPYKSVLFIIDAPSHSTATFVRFIHCPRVKPRIYRLRNPPRRFTRQIYCERRRNERRATTDREVRSRIRTPAFLSRRPPCRNALRHRTTRYICIVYRCHFK